MTRLRRTIRPVLAGLLSLAGLFSQTGAASAADAPACRTFDRAPACCPHPPPQCCPATMSTPLDDAAVTAICGGIAAKGEKAAFQGCKRYFTRGEEILEVSFGREPGDVAALGKLRTDLATPRSKVTALTVAGATQAFGVREIDDTGATQRSSAWALVDGEILHVEAEHSACEDAQVPRLLAHAIERVRAARAATRPPS